MGYIKEELRKLTEDERKEHEEQVFREWMQKHELIFELLKKKGDILNGTATFWSKAGNVQDAGALYEPGREYPHEVAGLYAADLERFCQENDLIYKRGDETGMIIIKWL